ncbi:DUF6585 family protein [Streptomyces sp. NPDC056632]|uniref:DUF6585 family protein n=1 Tax=Streptomyces sp. NPDC056632 TaxID=3345884 RepID=UPI00367CFEFD
MERLDRVTVPPPDEAATRAAREAELGAYIRGFRARHTDGLRVSRRRPWAPALVLLVALASLALPALASRAVGPPLGVPLLLVPFGATGWLLWRSLRTRVTPLRPRDYVYLYERGLVCPGEGGPARAVAWRCVTAMHQDVTRVHVHGGYAGTHYAYRLRTGARSGVTVGGFLDEETVPRPADSQIRELAQIVLDETVRRAMPPAVDALEAGEAVVFGEVSLYGHGIGLRSGRVVPWERVRRCDWRGDGLVVVRTTGAGRWTREAKDIPDFPVFWALIKELFPQAREFRR